MAVESGWEILENTDFIINRYREATISLDYYGDSVINSISRHRRDVVRIPARVTAADLAHRRADDRDGDRRRLRIRDNLLLNIIMLIYPLDAIRRWQAGG